MATASPRGRGEEVFEITESETATIDGRHWDKTIVGGRTVDAVHRSVLLRFPGAADDIALCCAGHGAREGELALTYAGYEIVPDGYTCATAWGKCGPRIRRPGTSSLATAPALARRCQLGPTFNASARPRYWARYGATIPPATGTSAYAPQSCRFAQQARLDITPAGQRADPRGRRAAVRVDNGFVLRKLETYDWRYREPGDAYEWVMPTGGHGLASPTRACCHVPLPATAASPSRGHPIAASIAALRGRRLAADGDPPTARCLARGRQAWLPDQARLDGRSRASPSCSASAATSHPGPRRGAAGNKNDRYACAYG